MAGAAPASATWIAEDDLLLKNSIEAGASLEALAKGAVKFSRRFTYEELQDRWHSLLYDPEVSAQAAARMFELELAALCPSSKSIKSENHKGIREFPQKRKRASIRKQYYAMRKKFRDEFFSSTDLGFLDEPSLHECHGNGADFREPHDGNFISDNLGLHEAELDILRNVFPDSSRDYAASSGHGGANSVYHVEHSNPIVNDYPSGMLRNEFSSDASAAFRQGERGSSTRDTKCSEISHSHGNVLNFGKNIATKGSGLLQVPPGKRIFKSSEKKQLSTFDSADDNPENICCDFGVSQDFSSPNSEGNSSLQVTGFPSPQPNLPLWKTMEDIPAPPMPVGMSNQDTAQDAETVIPNISVCKEEGSSVFGIVHSEPFQVVEQNDTDFMNSSTVSDGDFVDLSDSLLNLSNEDEMLFMDVDDKDRVDRRTSYSKVNSILQNSPKAVEGELTVKVETEMVMVEETGANSTMRGTKPSLSCSDPQIDSHIEVNVPSTSGARVEYHGLDSGVICCTLNTEDPEIPCNDDIFLLIHPSTAFASSTTTTFTSNSLEPASTADGKVHEERLNLSSKGKDSSRSFQWPQKMGTNSSPDTHRPGCFAKSELLEANHPGVRPANASKALEELSCSRLSRAIPNLSADRLFDGDVARPQSRGGDATASLAEAPRYAEADMKVPVPEPGINSLESDSDEYPSDDDVPYFSDVEALILGMDLDPPDEDPSISRQVSRYQHEETKRTIMRLEQCARSCMQRALTSQGAFAIFYGRHLKHYITKTEVVLGRSTDDVDVDIDLRKEGRANKISRRQAMIKMETDGSFSLKNIGKSIVSVNGKAVVSGQSLILGSSCLIEIRGMSFVFEINHKYVRRYLDATARRSDKKNEFDFSPDGMS